MTSETRMHSFQTPAPIRLRVEIPAGHIRVVADDTTETRVELSARPGDTAAQALIDDAEITQAGDAILVRLGKPRLRLLGFGGAVEAVIHAPIGSTATLTTQSGRIETSGRLGEVHASTASGAIRLDDSAEARAHSASGDIDIAGVTGSVVAKTHSGRITVGQVGGHARIATASGRAELAGCVGDAKVSTASGDIEVGEAGDSLDANAASGSIRILRTDHGRVRATSLSGQVSIGVANNAAARLDISTTSGRVNSQLESGGPPEPGESRVELTVSTTSGNVNLRRA